MSEFYVPPGSKVDWVMVLCFFMGIIVGACAIYPYWPY
jgi:hypothetical protein